MDEKQLSPDVLSIMGEKYKEILEDYRNIDQTFIKQGFLTVQAAMECDQSLFGKGCYERMLVEVTQPERINEWNSVSDAVHQFLYDNYEKKCKTLPKKYFDAIINRDDLSCFAKKDLLQRFYPEKLEALLLPCWQSLREKEKEQNEKLCKIWCNRPVERLLDEMSVPLRKEVFNSVMPDAFGEHGFVKRKRIKGIDVYHKPLSDKYSLQVKLDYVSLTRVTQDLGSDYDVGYWQQQILDWSYSVVSTNKRSNTTYYDFCPFFYAYSDYCKRFRDIFSLEVSIRAAALYYELVILPFEEIFKKQQLIGVSS